MYDRRPSNKSLPEKEGNIRANNCQAVLRVQKEDCGVWTFPLFPTLSLISRSDLIATWYITSTLLGLFPYLIPPPSTLICRPRCPTRRNWTIPHLQRQ